MYCRYCGRVRHRCQCMTPDSTLSQLLARRQPPQTAIPAWQAVAYKRGVPPQIKRQERAALRSQYKRLLAEVISRDGAGCANCGESESGVVDHILPIAKGGRSELDNLQILCAVCNRIKAKLWLDCRPSALRKA